MQRRRGAVERSSATCWLAENKVCQMNEWPQSLARMFQGKLQKCISSNLTASAGCVRQKLDICRLFLLRILLRGTKTNFLGFLLELRPNVDVGVIYSPNVTHLLCSFWIAKVELGVIVVLQPLFIQLFLSWSDGTVVTQSWLFLSNRWMHLPIYCSFRVSSYDYCLCLVIVVYIPCIYISIWISISIYISESILCQPNI